MCACGVLLKWPPLPRFIAGVKATRRWDYLPLDLRMWLEKVLEIRSRKQFYLVVLHDTAKYSIADCAILVW